MPLSFALIEQPIHTGSSPKTDSLELKNDKGTASEPSEFGQLIATVMAQVLEKTPPSGRQDLTAEGSVQTHADGKTQDAKTGDIDKKVSETLPGSELVITLGGDLLKAVHLGPHLNVITAETSAPDEQSLEAFARSQGLDENAVQWLMGNTPALTHAPREVLTPVSAPPSTPDGTDPLSLLSTRAPIQAQILVPTQPATDPSADLSLAPPAAGHANLPPDAFKTGLANKSEPNLAMNMAALWAMAQASDKSRVAQPAPQGLTDDMKTPIHGVAQAAPAAIWMLRNTVAVTAPKTVVSPKAGISVSEVDLTQLASPQTIESLEQMASEGRLSAFSDTPMLSDGHAAHRHDRAAKATTDPTLADASAMAPESDRAQRSEDVQKLADKMGQAVGQRILSEIEKGQWHLKLSLRPATLGHIEVEMRMRSGELDAVFMAQQAVTRELLQEGMPKLKETLNQMGMDVASMQVGDGQSQKRGGESTPEQMSKSIKRPSDETEARLSATPVPAPRMKMGDNGWDVLV